MHKKLPRGGESGTRTEPGRKLLFEELDSPIDAIASREVPAQTLMRLTVRLDRGDCAIVCAIEEFFGSPMQSPRETRAERRYRAWTLTRQASDAANEPGDLQGAFEIAS